MSEAPVVAAAKQLFAAVSEPGAGEGLGRDGWLDVLSDAQAATNVLAAVQAVAMAQAAAFDTDDGHGVGPTRHRGLGHGALDAPDLVAGRIGCSSQAATGRVGAAIEQVTTMPALVVAMAEGALDGFRAAVVADELSDAPAEVRAAVLDDLVATGHLVAETAGPLRRRTRSALNRLAPEVLAARVTAERARRGLHRSTEACGLDHWEAWLPVESSRPAWAAVTERAQERLRAGEADTLAQARADALLDLVLGRATGTWSLQVTVPVQAVPGQAAPGADAVDDLVPVTGLGVPGPAYVSRRWLHELSTTPAPRRPGGRRARRVDALAIDAGTGALRGRLVADGDSAARATVPDAPGYHPSAELDRLVRARDGHCRFPGCAVPVRFVDLDHVVPYDRGGPTALANLVCLCRRHHRTKQRPGWSAMLHPDGRMTWTDPSGRTRTTWPQDHRGPSPPPRPVPRTAPLGDVTDACPSALPDLDDEARARELEPFSLLEDLLLTRLRASTGEAWASVHNAVPRHLRRCARPAAATTGGARDRVDVHARPTLAGRALQLSPAWLAEAAAAAKAREAPPF